MTLWDVIGAGALLERERFGLGRGPAAIRVQQGEKDKILKTWGRSGLSELRRVGRKLDLENLRVRTSQDAGHTYLVEDAVSFFEEALTLP